MRPSAAAARLIVDKVTDVSSASSSRWITARLVFMRRASSAVTVDPRGALQVTDDLSNTLWRVTPTGP